MNKKKLAKSVVGIALIVSVAILIVVCVGKIKHIQNKKNIIGTWKNANAEEVFTFQENGGLVVNKDMPELGITCGNALYSISSSNMIFVEQRDNSVNFEIEGKYVIICTLPLKKTCRPSGGTFYFFFLVRNPSGNSFDHGKSRFRSSGFGKGPILRSSSNT